MIRPPVPTSSHLTRLFPVLAAVLIVAAGTLFAGPINPPAGPVASTNKTLQEVEPRIAINLANTPGDADSLFKITQPGSYYLTGNITGVVGKHGIEIAAGGSGVTLDLMGFDLSGIPAMGAFDGVSVTVASLTNITVRNGSVRNWGGGGVDLGSLNSINSAVIAVRASGNAGNGIGIGAGGTISGCTTSSNTGSGISASNVCVVLACTASSNGRSGIVGGTSSTINGCSADGNGVSSTGLSEGIFAGDGSSIIGCSSQNNTSLISGGVGDMGMGFRTANRCIIKDCTASRNRGHGFRILGNSLISGCSGSENGSGSTSSAVIHVAGTGNRIDGNQTNGSDFGIQVIAVGNVIIRNAASGNGTNYNFVADNIYGPLIDRRIPTTVATTAAVNGATAASTLGSTDANANFSY